MCFSVMGAQDIKRLEAEFNAKADMKSFSDYALKAAADPKKLKRLDAHPRIFQNYYAPVILEEPEGRTIRPMRYRLRPSWSEEEVPSKFNLFNARLDAFETRKSWQPLFMKRHALLAMEWFYEWITDEKRSEEMRRPGLQKLGPEQKRLARKKP